MAVHPRISCSPAAAQARAQSRRDRERVETVMEPESELVKQAVDVVLARNHFQQTAEMILSGRPR